ncbi:hypothetical protein HNV11_08860 [Spirosoma taeanense]|uniref:Uncharacterized protein n=2 Tax=Spirosoma taeanense TaxID=2735870 RepID=A0A6M5YF91_9BACT|nr:hypothetical protein HNV11_08860 [Spirosoma taeanense]
MLLSRNIYKSLDWTLHTVRFFRRHFLVIFGLGLVAALGRTIQLKAFGPISPSSNALIEVVVESARLAIFLYALGLSNVRKGTTRFIEFVANRQSRRQNWQLGSRKLRRNWPALLGNLFIFSLLAFFVNAFINHIAYETCLYITLKTRQLISGQASEWVLILFFKNLSVIPFTLIFSALFWLWLVNRLPKPITYT